MRINRQSLITLGLVAIVGVGLIGAYANACDNEKTAQQASAHKECTAEQMAACQAQKASAEKAGCCMKSGATQASVATEGGAAIIPVGGAACSHATGATKASGSSCGSKAGATHAGAACTFEGAANCSACKLYKTYWTSLENSSRDIATLPNGIIVHYASADPTVVAELQKYAAEKATLAKAISSGKFDGTLCEFCTERAKAVKGASFQVTNSSGGVFTMITSKKAGTVEALHRIAAAETEAEATTAQTKVEG
jgi:Tfp pilus assembly protein PilV